MPERAANRTGSKPPRPALALAAVYAALFVSAGFYLPFFPLFLSASSLSPEAIGLIVAVPMAMRLFANPAAGTLSDRIGRPRRFLAALGLGAALAFALMALVPGPAALFVLVAIATVFWGPAFPLTDAFGVRLARERGIDYGRARLWGSVSFIGANIGLGAALHIVAPQAVVWFISGALLMFAASAMLMPRLDTPAGDAANDAPRFSLRVVLGVFAAAAVQSSHALLYTFGSVHWVSIGISPAMVGVLWAAGVAAEVVVFYFATAALRRFSALGLILIGGVSSMLRFALTALDPPQWLLLPLMTMHAFTFTATYLGMVTLAGASGGAAAQGRAQTFASAAVSIAMLLATLAAGPLYARYGVYAFFGSSAIATLGCLLALMAMAQPQNEGSAGNTRAPS